MSDTPEQIFATALEHFQSDRLEDAAKILKGLHKRHPKAAEAAHLLGVVLLQMEKPNEAARYLKKADKIIPNSPEILTLLGCALKSSGKQAAGFKTLEKAVKAGPDHADAHYNFARALADNGQWAEAASHYEAAVAADPGLADAHYNLGLALRKLGRNEDAVAAFQDALDQNPNQADVLSSLGAALGDLGRTGEAAGHLQRAVDLDPGCAAAFFNLGLAMQAQGKAEEAAAAYRHATGIEPDFADALNNLAGILQDSGRHGEALGIYRRIIGIKPDDVPALNLFSLLSLAADKVDDAEAACRQAMSTDPENAEAHANLGAILLRRGHFENAIESYERSLAIEDDSRVEMALATALPVIMPPVGQLRDLKENFESKIQALRNKEPVQRHRMDSGGVKPAFYLAYHAENDRELFSAIHDCYAGIFPDLIYEAPYCREKIGKKKVLRIGFLSAYFHDHTIGKLLWGVIEKFSRDRFEVILIRPHGKRDEIADLIDKSADRVVLIPEKPEAARKIIEEEKLDILFYPDIGMSPLTYALAFSRLAPVQAVSWGHPVTTGLPAIDYFLSTGDMEPADAEDHYCEQLIRLDNFPAYYFPPPEPGETLERKHFGLPEEAKIYLCPQTLYKFHPEFDSVLGGLLRADHKGILVLISGSLKEWDGLLLDRFRDAFPEQAGRVVFLDRMTMAEYLGLLRLADVVLDTSHFCGGNSSLESFAMGVPIITWPGEFMRGRVTLGYYDKMGFMDLVAEDAESYARLAHRVANDREFHARCSRIIREKAGVLFETADAVRELEQFFITAHEARRTRNGADD